MEINLKAKISRALKCRPIYAYACQWCKTFTFELFTGHFFGTDPTRRRLDRKRMKILTQIEFFASAISDSPLNVTELGLGGGGWGAVNIVTCAYQFWADLHLRFFKQNFFNGLYLYLYKILIHIEILFFASDFFLAHHYSSPNGVKGVQSR